MNGVERGLAELEHARRMLREWRAAEVACASGVKSYRINNRELTRYDLAEIRRSIEYWEERVAVLEGRKNGRRIRRAVFYDL